MVARFLQRWAGRDYCVAINDEKSFKSVAKWITSLDDNALEHILIPLVRNRIDLAPDRVVPTATGEVKEASCDARFCEVSEKTGKGITEPFEDIPERQRQEREYGHGSSPDLPPLHIPAARTITIGP
jgi:GTPase SAR1 family protein